MRYFGGKWKIGKQIAEYLSKVRKPGQLYIEPFVGMAGVFNHMANDRYGYDIHPDVIALLIGIRDKTFTPPTTVTEKEYIAAKKLPSSALRGFIGFGCSFSGKFFGGYARDDRGRNYASDTALSLKKYKLDGSKLEVGHYLDLDVKGALIYCDPPYANTTGFSSTEPFSPFTFWNWVRRMSRYNDIYVSEYKAPPDFVCVWEKPVKSTVRSDATKAEIKIEKLFKLGS